MTHHDAIIFNRPHPLAITTSGPRCASGYDAYINANLMLSTLNLMPSLTMLKADNLTMSKKDTI